MNPEQIETIARSVCSLRNYSFGGFVGAGAFKRTFRVQRPDGTSLALKVFRPGTSKERTEREIDAMKRCSHPGVCRLEEIFVFESDGVGYTVTTEEFLDGGTLGSRVNEQGRLAPVEARRLGSELINAMIHIAALGLVHRDIKPDNIMFRGSAAVLVDFGLVRDLNAPSLTQTWLAHGPGTPFFASPEQLRNEKSLIDWRSDQFSLAVTLAMCAFGYHPFARSSEPLETVEQVMKRVGPSERFVVDARDAGLGTLVKMAAPWPVQRYRTGADLATKWNSQGE